MIALQYHLITVCYRIITKLMESRLVHDFRISGDRTRIDQLVDTEERNVVRFTTPVDVMLIYWTTSPDPDSGLQFHPDVYQRDPSTLELLEEKPRWAAL